MFKALVFLLQNIRSNNNHSRTLYALVASLVKHNCFNPAEWNNNLMAHLNVVINCKLNEGISYFEQKLMSNSLSPYKLFLVENVTCFNA